MDESEINSPEARPVDLAKLEKSIYSIRRLLIFLAISSLVIIVYFAKDIVMPVALGLLLALTLRPPVRLLVRFKVPSAIAAILVVCTIGSIVGIGGYLLTDPLSELFSTVPDIGQGLKEKLEPYRQSLEAISDASTEMEDLAVGPSSDAPEKVVVEQPGLISSAASSVGSGLTSFAIAFVLALLVLASDTLFYEKLIAVMPALSEKKQALTVVYRVEESVSTYLFTITCINVALGATVALLLEWYGAPNSILWGVIATLLNYVPFIGAVLGASLLAVVSIGVYDTIGTALVAPLLYFSCSVVEGNFVTPAIVGRRLQLNTVAVFLAVTIWGWLWGIAGALMAVPILLIIKVLCDHIPSWGTLGEFLSGRSSSRKT